MYPPPTPEQAAKLAELMLARPTDAAFTLSLELPLNGQRPVVAKQVQEWCALGDVDEFGAADPQQVAA